MKMQIEKRVIRTITIFPYLAEVYLENLDSDIVGMDELTTEEYRLEDFNKAEKKEILKELKRQFIDEIDYLIKLEDDKE